MNQALFTVVMFVGLLALIPAAIKWYKQRLPGAADAVELSANRLVSVLAVGQQQRILTVEVGPAGARIWLVLGVTPQSITTLHTLAPPTSAVRATELSLVHPDAAEVARGPY